MTAPVRRNFPCVALPYSRSAEIEAEVIDARQGMPADFDSLGEEVKARIAVVSAGPHGSRFSKYRRAEASGAVAFLFVSDLPGMLVRTGTLPREPGSRDPGASIPGVAVCKEIGDELLRWARRGSVKVQLRMTNAFAEATSWNVVAEVVPECSVENGVLVAGVHFDSHDISPGATDNGIGTAALLETARLLAHHRSLLKRPVTFIFFACEEIGLLGSKAYVKTHADDLRNIRFMLNLDVLGRGKPGDERLILMGRPDLVPLFRQVASEMELSLPVSSEVWHGGADQVSFSENGVPAAILVDGVAGGWAHTEADTVDKVSRKTLRLAADIATRLLLEVSRAENRLLTNVCE